MDKSLFQWRFADDPNTGRFINADGQINDGLLGMNLYAYCENDPINLSDPFGNTPFGADSDSYWEAYRRGMNEYYGRIMGFRDVTEEIYAALSYHATLAHVYRYAYQNYGIIGDAALYSIFYDLVNHNAPWDIKRKEPWESTIGTPFPGQDEYVIFNGLIMTPEMLGNFTYGFLGCAFGFSYEILLLGSFYAAGHYTMTPGALYNEWQDWESIQFGYYGIYNIKGYY